MKIRTSILALSLGITSSSYALQDFDNKAFANNGPLQRGTVKIDRSKTQTVITWCTPSLLKMEVLSGAEHIPIDHVQTNYGSLPRPGGAHPEQVSVTVYPATLPFSYTKNYGTPQYVTSVCSPTTIHTTLQQAPPQTTKLMHAQNVTKPFSVKPSEPTVIQIDCSTKKIGYHFGAYTGPAFGKVGGVAMLPKGDKAAKIQGSCDDNGSFSVTIQ